MGEGGPCEPLIPPVVVSDEDEDERVTPAAAVLSIEECLEDTGTSIWYSPAVPTWGKWLVLLGAASVEP